MIYINSRKLTVDGIDVYPDHESPTQFWYVPGTVRLAQRNGRKQLSYLWYTDSTADADGTGFLNFEVDTAVPAETLGKIRAQIASSWGADAQRITLSTVPYRSGAVNFSVLGPVAAQAGVMKGKDPAVLYQSKEQLVWNAGSSSLVGDNAAVCSVKFSKEGRLAAAMKTALHSKGSHIAALYRLEFLAMRPAVTFTVKGTFEKTIQDFQASIGAQIPLEALVLDVGIQAQWKKIMQNTDLKIEVVKYDGDDAKEGLKWAQQILLSHVLKTFFQVQVGDSGAWSPLSEAPQVEEAVEKAKDAELAATEKVEQEKGDSDAQEVAKVVKEVVKAATTFIPRVNIRASYSRQQQVNSIDFLYAEKCAKPMLALPQALVGLDSGDRPQDYITQINRAQDPFGLPYRVPVALPAPESLAALGLEALNIQARYPAGLPSSRQQTLSLSINAGKVLGDNPLPFQYDARGSSNVEYSASFIFKPTDAWQSDSCLFEIQDSTEKGLITAMPESVAEFLVLDVALDADFVWDAADQAVVLLSSRKWNGDKRLVFQKGRETAQVLRVRSPAQRREEPVEYRVELLRGRRVLHSYGPLPLQGRQLTVSDRYATHVPVFFSAAFPQGSAEVTLVHEEGDEVWEDQFTIDAGQKKVLRIIPVLRQLGRKSELTARYEAVLETGETLAGDVRGGANVILRSAR